MRDAGINAMSIFYPFKMMKIVDERVTCSYCMQSRSRTQNNKTKHGINEFMPTDEQHQYHI